MSRFWVDVALVMVNVLLLILVVAQARWNKKELLRRRLAMAAYAKMAERDRMREAEIRDEWARLSLVTSTCLARPSRPEELA